MRIILFLTAVLFISACSGGPDVSQEPVTNTKDQSERVSETVASHTVDGEREQSSAKNTAVPAPPKDGAKRKWSRSGDPIDTAKFDAGIEKATADLKAKSDDAAEKALGTAYFERGVALTAARQYASAIGDFRKAVKYDSANEDAKQQIALITSIYNSMNIEVPAEGEEPAALEFKK